MESLVGQLKAATVLASFIEMQSEDAEESDRAMAIREALEAALVAAAL